MLILFFGWLFAGHFCPAGKSHHIHDPGSGAAKRVDIDLGFDHASIGALLLFKEFGADRPMILGSLQVRVVFCDSRKNPVLDRIDVRQIHDIGIFVERFKSPLEKEQDRLFFARRVG